MTLSLKSFDLAHRKAEDKKSICFLFISTVHKVKKQSMGSFFKFSQYIKHCDIKYIAKMFASLRELG